MNKPTTFKNILIKPEDRAEQFNKGIKSKERVKRHGEVFTPDSIVIDMLDMLNQEIDDKNFIDVTFLEPSCGNGQFLVRILYRKLLQVQKLQVEQRKNAIIKVLNSIYGIDILEDNVEEAKDRMLNLIIGNTVKSFDLNNTVKNISINMGIDFKEDFIEELNSILDNNIIVGDALKDDIDFKIDVVVGNPPYNRDMYMPFVERGNDLAEICSLWITPARWASRNNAKEMRDNIKQYLDKITFFINSNECFDISVWGGICYYLLVKSKKDTDIKVKTISKKCNGLNGVFTAQTTQDYFHFWSFADKIINKFGDYNTFTCKYNSNDNYFFHCPNTFYMSESAGLPVKAPHMVYVLSNVSVNNDSEFHQNDVILYSSNDEITCKSVESYFKTRLVRFMLWVGMNIQHPFTRTLNSDTELMSLRYVPEQSNYNHIFTDEELYKKYNLTDEEINIIESVIKERK